MKYWLTVLFLILIAVVVWPLQILNFLGPSELKYEVLLFLNKNKLEKVLEEASKTDYEEIFVNQQKGVVYAKNDVNGERVDSPHIDKLLEVKINNEVKGIWIRRQYSGWLLMEMYDVSINDWPVTLMFYYGGEPTIVSCSKLKIVISGGEFCFEKVYENWYITKFWTPKDV